MPAATITIAPPPLSAVTASLLDGLASRLDRAFRFAAGPIGVRVGQAAADAIRASPVYAALVGGALKGEMGVVDPERVLKAVCDNIAAGVLVTPLGARRVGYSLQGGLRVEVLKGDYSEVLSADGASFTSEGGYQIDWLRWLTLEGDRVIVSDHSYSAAFNPRSRTGMGLMIHRGTWRVPPEYAGTAADNWVTRALAGIGPLAEAIIAQEVQRNT